MILEKAGIDKYEEVVKTDASTSRPAWPGCTSSAGGAAKKTAERLQRVAAVAVGKADKRIGEALAERDDLEELTHRREHECLFGVATRPSSLRIHRRKVAGASLLPESGQSSPAAHDPEAPVSFLQSSRSAERHLCAVECSKAAVRDLTQPARSGLSAAPQTGHWKDCFTSQPDGIAIRAHRQIRLFAFPAISVSNLAAAVARPKSRRWSAS